MAVLDGVEEGSGGGATAMERVGLITGVGVTEGVKIIVGEGVNVSVSVGEGVNVEVLVLGGGV